MNTFPCQRIANRPQTRRQWLSQCANGFGAMALAALMHEGDYGGYLRAAEPDVKDPLAPRRPHFEAKAKNVIFLYMDGGPSQVDTFDPKPRLTQDNGKPFGAKMEPTQFNNNGATLGSPWKFANYGECGLPVSELFPHVAQHADKLAVIRSMTSDFSEHTNANYFLHTGSGLQGRPSMGAWVGYGLGSECRNLPGFVVLNGGLIPPGGLDNFNSGFLPAAYQGSIFAAHDMPVANVRPEKPWATPQQKKLDLMARLDEQLLARTGKNDAIESAIANYELAQKMQVAVPDLTKLDQESAATQEQYGVNHRNKHTAIFGRQCLLARRLVERGVRFIELTCPNTGGDRWDQHGNLKKGHEDNAFAVDQPIGALLGDLEQRGLLKSTLVVWAGEFGRTPFAQGSNGRDHNPFGFSIWLAGAGIKGGTVYGATDEFGYKAVDGVCKMHDLHATMLHLLGIEHTKLTYYFGGRNMRLTDVYGEVIKPVLA